MKTWEDQVTLPRFFCGNHIAKAAESKPKESRIKETGSLPA